MTRRRTRAAGQHATAGLALAAALLAASTPAVAQDPDEPWFTFSDATVDESSGAVVVDDVLLTVEDRENVSDVVLVDTEDGSTITRVRLVHGDGRRVENVDIEDLAVVAGRDGPDLLVADTGGATGGRTSWSMHRVPLDEVLDRPRSVRVRTLELTASAADLDGDDLNVEAVLADPGSGRIVLVDKRGGRLWAVPPGAPASGTAELVLAGRIDPEQPSPPDGADAAGRRQLTGGAVDTSAGQQHLRTYGDVLSTTNPTGNPLHGLHQQPRREVLPVAPQGEAVAVDGSALVLTSEAGDAPPAPVHRVPAPDEEPTQPLACATPRATVPGSGTTGRRVAAPDRFATAVALSRDVWTTGADTVVVASGAAFPDALAGAALAARRDAPLLLVRPDRLPTAVGDELARLDPATVLVVGGTAAIADATLDDVRDRADGADVLRLSGADRFATAAAVAEHVRDVDDRPTRTAVVASGAGFPDAVAATQVAARTAGVVLLTAPASLPVATRDAVLASDTVAVAGGGAAVAPGVAAQLEDRAGDVVRLAGTDRYATAACLSGAGVQVPTARTAYLASGVDFPDALAVGPAAAAYASPVLLTDPDVLPPSTADVLGTWCPEEVVAVGGTAAISDGVMAAAVAAVEARC